MNQFQTHPLFQKLTKKLRKQFNKLPKDHTKLKELHQYKDINSLTKTTQSSESYETLKSRGKELYLEIEKVSK